MNKKIANIIRIVVSLSLLSFLIYRNKDNFESIIDKLKDLNVTFLVIAVLLYTLALACIPLRWGILLKAHNYYISGSFLLQSAFIGFFYNNLLPTSIGGDFYRVYDLYKNKNVPINENISAVVMERVIGNITGITYFIFSFAFGIFGYLTRGTKIGLAISLFVILFFFTLLFRPRLFKIHVLLARYRIFSKIRPKLKSFHQILVSYRYKIKHLSISFFYSLLLQLIFIISYYFVSLSLGLDLKFYMFIFAVPFASLAASIPISIGGIGIRENAIVFAVMSFGVVESQATLFSFIILFIILFNGLLGGIVYLFKNIFYRSRGII